MKQFCVKTLILGLAGAAGAVFGLAMFGKLEYQNVLYSSLCTFMLLGGINGILWVGFWFSDRREKKRKMELSKQGGSG